MFANTLQGTSSLPTADTRIRNLATFTFVQVYICTPHSCIMSLILACVSSSLPVTDRSFLGDNLAKLKVAKRLLHLLTERNDRCLPTMFQQRTSPLRKSKLAWCTDSVYLVATIWSHRAAGKQSLCSR